MERNAQEYFNHLVVRDLYNHFILNQERNETIQSLETQHYKPGGIKAFPLKNDPVYGRTFALLDNKSYLSIYNVMPHNEKPIIVLKAVQIYEKEIIDFKDLETATLLKPSPEQIKQSIQIDTIAEKDIESSRIKPEGIEQNDLKKINDTLKDPYTSLSQHSFDHTRAQVIKKATYHREFKVSDESFTEHVETGTFAYKPHYHPSGKEFVISSIDTNLHIYSLRNNKWQITDTLRGHSSEVWVSRYTPDGKQILSGDNLGNLKVWEKQNSAWQCIQTLDDHKTHLRFSENDTPKIHDIAINHAGTQAVTTSITGNFIVWNRQADGSWKQAPDTIREQMTINDQTSTYNAAWSHDDTKLAVTSWDRICVYTYENDVLKLSYKKVYYPQRDRHHVAWSLDNSFLLSIRVDSNIVEFHKLSNKMTKFKKYTELEETEIDNPDYKEIHAIPGTNAFILSTDEGEVSLLEYDAHNQSFTISALPFIGHKARYIDITSDLRKPLFYGFSSLDDDRFYLFLNPTDTGMVIDVKTWEFMGTQTPKEEEKPVISPQKKSSWPSWVPDGIKKLFGWKGDDETASNGE